MSLSSHVFFYSSRIALLLVMLVCMVIDTVYLTQGIFLNSRRLRKGQWESHELVISWSSQLFLLKSESWEEKCERLEKL